MHWILDWNSQRNTKNKRIDFNVVWKIWRCHRTVFDGSRLECIMYLQRVIVKFFFFCCHWCRLEYGMCWMENEKAQRIKKLGRKSNKWTNERLYCAKWISVCVCVRKFFVLRGINNLWFANGMVSFSALRVYANYGIEKNPICRIHLSRSICVQFTVQPHKHQMRQYMHTNKQTNEWERERERERKTHDAKYCIHSFITFQAH